MQQLSNDQLMDVEIYRITSLKSRPHAYEGHMFHDEVTIQSHQERVAVQAGDFLIDLDQPHARYAIETLEPQGHDSFFRWGFFNSCLEKKEAFSDYVFEDTAAEILRDEPATRAAFDAWKQENPASLNDQAAVLDFIFTHSERFIEPEWNRYPVLRII